MVTGVSTHTSEGNLPPVAVTDRSLLRAEDATGPLQEAEAAPPLKRRYK